MAAANMRGGEVTDGDRRVEGDHEEYISVTQTDSSERIEEKL